LRRRLKKGKKHSAPASSPYFLGCFLSWSLGPASANDELREDVKRGVYVENLSEFEVQSVSDILRLLIQ
ncbi:hypothetical protein PIB30_077318, partial [Stylosanthes scabra]|nr:hypothetical protein [Stylosanthes scabra]